MKTNSSKLWYASYGSNTLESRFHCYIKGGKPEGSATTYEGCTLKTLPEANRPMTIPGEVYFAKQSKTWHGGGVAFIGNQFSEENHALGRMYLITADQFTEVVKQEIGHTGPLEIDLEKVKAESTKVVKDQALYGRIIHLGEEEGHPIFTFTHQTDLSNEINPPGPEYLGTIIRGLKETHDLERHELIRYFQRLEGIYGTRAEDHLNGLINTNE